MPFQKGKEKTGGRKKGTHNKATGQFKESIDLILESELERFKTDLDQLEPKERVNVILKLLEFTVPKLQRTESEHEFKEPVSLPSIYWANIDTNEKEETPPVKWSESE